MTEQRKYFGTDGIRGRVGQSAINPEFVLKLGWAIGRVLVNGVRRKVLIGKDTRISGYMLEASLEAGLSAAGVDIRLLGPMPTPALAYLTQTFRAQAGIMISASHNPYFDNGIKFFGPDGFKLPDEMERKIEAQIEKPLETVDSKDLGRAERIDDATGRYIEFCKSTIPARTRMTGLKVVLDCANGATYRIAPYVFSELGASVTTINSEPDGFNINAACGAIDLKHLQQTVLEQNADLGIAFDGDGDRVMMVDHKGEIVDGDEIVYMIGKHRLERNVLQGGVVGTVMSNYGLERALGELKIPFVRSLVGDRYVLAELLKQGWELGGENSGHVICLSNTTTGDGIVSALQVLFAMYIENCDLHSLKQGMHKMPQILVNVEVGDPKRVASDAAMVAAVKDVEQQLSDRGRVLVRASGTEPVVRIMIESDDATRNQTLAEQLAECVKSIN